LLIEKNITGGLGVFERLVDLCKSQIQLAGPSKHFRFQ